MVSQEPQRIVCNHWSVKTRADCRQCQEFAGVGEVDDGGYGGD